MKKDILEYQMKSRTASLDDGMSEEEAILDAELPLKGVVESMEKKEDGSNLLKLKKLSIRLMKLPFIEKAMKEGCPFILLTEV